MSPISTTEQLDELLELLLSSFGGDTKDVPRVVRVQVHPLPLARAPRRRTVWPEKGRKWNALQPTADQKIPAAGVLPKFEVWLPK